MGAAVRPQIGGWLIIAEHPDDYKESLPFVYQPPQSWSPGLPAVWSICL